MIANDCKCMQLYAIVRIKTPMVILSWGLGGPPSFNIGKPKKTS